MVSKIATLKDRNGNKLLPRTVFEAVQSNSGNTLDSALNDKLDKTDVVNTNTETVLGKALDAIQNNPNVSGSLAKQIGDLSKKALQFRGIVNTISALDKDGYYCVSGGDATFPYAYGNLMLTTTNDGVYTEKIATYDTTGVDKKNYKNIMKTNGEWNGWKRLSTSDEITALQSDIDKSGWSVEGSKKIIPNVLFIGDDYNTGKWGCVSGQTLNMPTDVEVGIRETLAYDNNNVTIRVTENRPTKGRIWINSCDGSNWTGWSILATTIESPITIKPDLGITPIFLTPKVVVTNGNTFSISGGLKLTKPLVDGTVVMSFPINMYPKYPYHIFFNSWNYDIPYYCRLWADTDGNIKIYGASQFPTQEIDLDFSRTVTF